MTMDAKQFEEDLKKIREKADRSAFPKKWPLRIAAFAAEKLDKLLGPR